VLYITPVSERGGAEVVLLNILRHHDRARFTPIVCLLKAGPLSQDISALGIKWFSVSSGRFRNVFETVRAVREIRRIMRQYDVDLVFSNMAMGHLYGGLAVFGMPVKRVWFQHSISSGELIDRLAALIPADRLYTNSQASLRAIRHLHPNARGVQVIYPGTEIPHSVLPNERALIRRSLGVPEDALVVAMVGRFQRGKGQHVFIEAAKAVRRQRSEAYFLLVGGTQFSLEPEYKVELEDLVQRYRLSNAVVFAGWRNDVPGLLSAVDVLVHPAIAPEALGLVVVEALLQGKPVVVSRQGGLTEIVSEGETGFLVPPGDGAALASKILLLLSDEGLRKEMGERGRKLVLKRFTMSRMIEELEQSYVDILDGRLSAEDPQ